MNRHSKLVTILGVIALAVIVTVYSLFDSLFAGTLTDAATSGNTNTVANLNYDPLVTVVPDGARGGKPQPLSTDPQRGAEKPSVVIVEFGDFECEGCASMAPVMDQIVEAYPTEVLHVWKDFPIPSAHPYSETAAQAARCAQEQDAFWQYHDELFEVQKTFALQPWYNIADRLGLDDEDFAACLDNEVKDALVVQGYFIARTFEIDETPSYFINDELVTGVKTYAELKALVDQAIEKAKTQS